MSNFLGPSEPLFTGVKRSVRYIAMAKREARRELKKARAIQDTHERLRRIRLVHLNFCDVTPEWRPGFWFH